MYSLLPHLLPASRYDMTEEVSGSGAGLQGDVIRPRIWKHTSTCLLSCPLLSPMQVSQNKAYLNEGDNGAKRQFKWLVVQGGISCKALTHWGLTGVVLIILQLMKRHVKVWNSCTSSNKSAHRRENVNMRLTKEPVTVEMGFLS